MDILNINTPVDHLPDQGLDNSDGIIGGIVQNLDFKQFFRVIKPADGFDQPFDDIAFVVDRQLDGNPWPFLNGIIQVKSFLGLCMLPKGLRAFQVITYHEQVAVHPVSEQRKQGN